MTIKMSLHARVILVAILLHVTSRTVQGKCVMRGNLDSSTALRYDGDALPLNSSDFDTFVKLCPSMVNDAELSVRSVDTCCDGSQLNEFLMSSAPLDALMVGCDVCKENILRLTCNFLCHKNQADFSHVTLDPENNTVVTGLNFAMHYQFAEGIYNSCKNVKNPNSIISVFTFICTQGVNSSNECTPVKLVKSLLAFSTFSITPSFFNSSKGTGYKAMLNPSAAKCNTTYHLAGSVIKACGCLNCDLSCADLPQPHDQPSVIIRDYQYCVLFFGSAVLAGLISALAWSCFRNCPRFKVAADESIALANEDSAPEQSEELFMQSSERAFTGKIHKSLANFLRIWGAFVARHYVVFLILPILVIGVLASGIAFRFEVTSDPIEIWSPKSSSMRSQKKFFDQNFGPFYRTEQILIKTPTLSSSVESFGGENITFGPPMNSSVIMEMFYIQETIKALVATYKDPITGFWRNVTLNDICMKPLEPFNEKCVMFSITQYFNNSVDVFGMNGSEFDWRAHAFYCAFNAGSMKDDSYNEVSCLSDLMAPINPNLVFGGYTQNPVSGDTLVITYIVENHIEEASNQPACIWESKLLQFLTSYSHPYVEISFSTERSIQDEISRQSKTEIKTILLSYLAMFLYVTLALGSISGGIRSFFFHQQIILGLCGVILVLLCVLGSVGLFCYANTQINMIVLEVLPFITLAIGVDNIFLMVHEFRRVLANSPDMEIDKIVGEMVSRVGLGMMISAFAQVFTFSIGAISNIPAVRSFCIMAAVALMLNFIVQMTAFLAIFTLNVMRQMSRRLDVFCCIKVEEVEQTFSPCMLQRLFSSLSSLVFSFFGRPLIVTLFVVSWVVSLYYVPTVSIGLDQTVAFPQDSYLKSYFNDIFHKLRIGPPVYFMVTAGFKYEKASNQKLICSGSSCNNNSLTTTIYYQSLISNYSKIGTAADSWLDTYLAWLKPDDSSDGSCCSYKLTSNGSKQFCPKYKGITNCTSCISKPVGSAQPNYTEQEFIEYLPWFLTDIPVKDCPLGGKAAYSRSVVLNPDYYDKHRHNQEPILASSFMAYHTSMANSADMIQAMVQADKLSKNLTTLLNHSVIPYSYFYIFNESYFTIWDSIYLSFGISFVAIFFVYLALFGFNIPMGILLTFLTFIMDVVNGALMRAFNISVNPVSLVNLVMFLGINVEFLSHIARAYIACPANSRLLRAKIAFINTGSSVFSGIVMTKLLGISVLAFSTSLLFRIYYFKMYICAIIVGALHGLVVLPVLLSYIGPANKEL